MTAPESLATWAVLSLPPSTTTRVVTASPQASGGHGGQHGADVGLLLVGADEPDDGGELQVGVARVEVPARRRR